MIKNERIELRLNPELINKVDEWRRLQPDIPGRSESIRRLLNKSLSDNASIADFELAKFQIKTAALSPGVKENVNHAHVFAWDNGIYPLFQADEYAKPFKTHFKVSENQINQLATFLDEKWIQGKCYTFYELEEHFCNHGWEPKWDRCTLIDSLRYIKLSGRFNKKLWDTLLKSMKYPVEAGSITSDFNPLEELFL